MKQNCLGWALRLLVPLLLGLACGPVTEETEEPDAFAGPDAPVRSDGGPPEDLEPWDGGEVWVASFPDDDAGEADAGVTQADAGPQSDAAATPDAGSTPDAGTAHDAGQTRDAGTTVAHARRLNTSVVSLIVEPEGVGHDDHGTAYTDRNYWNFCVPGAVTAALYYWKPTNVTAWPAGRFREPAHAPSSIPSGGTYWTSDDTASGYHSKGRAYLMHLAMKVRPPNFTMAGVVAFASYPTTGGGLADARDVLNWEASAHASTWSHFFYVAVYASNVTQASLHSHIKQDIDGGHAVVIFASTAYLPNWDHTLWHAITVVGYDDDHHTYTYVDTCGKRCNGSPNARNGGLWTISQVNLTRAASHGEGYAW